MSFQRLNDKNFFLSFPFGLFHFTVMPHAIYNNNGQFRWQFPCRPHIPSTISISIDPLRHLGKQIPINHLPFNKFGCEGKNWLEKVEEKKNEREKQFLSIDSVIPEERSRSNGFQTKMSISHSWQRKKLNQITYFEWNATKSVLFEAQVVII